MFLGAFGDDKNTKDAGVPVGTGRCPFANRMVLNSNPGAAENRGTHNNDENAAAASGTIIERLRDYQ